jgi:ketosteroid isomerase-like protein
MRFCGRPIRDSLAVVTAVLLAAVFAVFNAQPALAAHAFREKKHDAKRQVEMLEEQWRTAQLTGDIATMDKLLSDDYIGISMSGQVNTKTQQLERVKSHKFQLTRLDLREMQVKLVGAIAIVTSRADVEGTNDGAPVKGTYRYTRVYQHLPTGEWKITSFESTRVPGSRESFNNKREREGEAAVINPQPAASPKPK